MELLSDLYPWVGFWIVRHPAECDDREDCPVQWELNENGWDGLMGSWEAHNGRLGTDDPEQYLAPGRYEVRAWVEHYPGGPWGGPEWDSGLEVEPILGELGS